MTPAKLVALMDKRMDRMELMEMPIARLSWLYINSKRDPGDPEKGKPPAPEVPFDDVRMFRRKRKGLDRSRTPAMGGSYNWEGVQGSLATKAAFQATMGPGAKRKKK